MSILKMFVTPFPHVSQPHLSYSNFTLQTCVFEDVSFVLFGPPYYAECVVVSTWLVELSGALNLLLLSQPIRVVCFFAGVLVARAACSCKSGNATSHFFVIGPGASVVSVSVSTLYCRGVNKISRVFLETFNVIRVLFVFRTRHVIVFILPAHCLTYVPILRVVMAIISVSVCCLPPYVPRFLLGCRGAGGSVNVCFTDPPHISNSFIVYCDRYGLIHIGGF